MNPAAIQARRPENGFPDESADRQLVVEQRGRRASGGRDLPKATLHSTSTPSARTFRPFRTFSNTWSTRARARSSQRTRSAKTSMTAVVLNAALVAEAIRTAQHLTGNKQVGGADVRRGSSRSTSPTRDGRSWACRVSRQPIHLSCADHNGHNLTSVVRWDGTKWNKTSETLEPIKDKVIPLINSAAQDYMKANAGWPKRTEACDKVAAK